MGSASKPNSFTRAMRIARSRDFERVFAARRSAADDFLVVYAAPNGLSWSRLGMLAGRRLGTAVERNRAKRLVREAFRTSRDRLPQGFDFVVVVRKDACKATFDSVESSLTGLANRARKRWRK